MGRNKEPIALINAKGKARKTKAETAYREAHEIKAMSDDIKAPDYLSDKLKARFDYYSNELQRINIMTNLDVEALSKYVVAEEQFQKIAAKCLKMSVLNPDYDDLLKKQEKLFNISRRAASDLGLTIASRCKLVLPENKKEPENKFSKFING